MKTRDFNNWFEAIQDDKTRAIAESAAYNFLYLTEAQAEKLWLFYYKKGNPVDSRNRVSTDNGLKFCPHFLLDKDLDFYKK